MVKDADWWRKLSLKDKIITVLGVGGKPLGTIEIACMIFLVDRFAGVGGEYNSLTELRSMVEAELEKLEAKGLVQRCSKPREKTTLQQG